MLYGDGLAIGHGACGVGKGTPIDCVFSARHADSSRSFDACDRDTVRGDDGAEGDIGLIGKAKGIRGCVCAPGGHTKRIRYTANA